MRKKVGIIKRVFCISLIFLLSINSFAAIVSDNDGSAFITKAEFDALKSSFQSQIDSYNQSIDSKIDGAIASYLAGIKLASTINLSCLLQNYGGTNIRWGWNPLWDTTVKEVSGFGSYFLNAAHGGYLCITLGAQYIGISDMDSDYWTDPYRGKGQIGRFFYAPNKTGKHFAYTYFNGSMLQCCTIADYYGTGTGMSMTNPWCANGVSVKVGESTKPTSYYSCDCFMNVVRRYDKNAPQDLQDVSMPWAMPSASCWYTSDIDNATVTTSNEKISNSASAYGISINDSYGYLKDWDMQQIDYTNLYFGNGESQEVQPKMYEGIPLCQLTTAGIVEINNMKITSNISTTSPYAYFAVSDGPFLNNDTLTGVNIEFEDHSSEIEEYIPGSHVYRVPIDTNISKIKFTINSGSFSNRFLYIKIAPQYNRPSTVSGTAGDIYYAKLETIPTIQQIVE